jgi:ribokinase
MAEEMVTVVGSYNVGFFFKGEQLPTLGETVIGDKFHEGGGGKGSNQAVAASRLGARTRFVGRIGFDIYGQNALSMYRNLGIQTDTVKVDTTIHTGMSVIIIDKKGHNLISVVPGANFRLSREDIDEILPVISDSSVVAFQLENRLDVVDYAIRKVHESGTLTFLDPAPAVKLPEDLFPCIDYIKPNETEATILTGIEVDGIESAKDAGRWLVDKGVKTVIVTLGELGATLITDSGTQHYYPPEVTAVDSTGAGDIFAGAFNTAVCQGKAVEDAIRFANCAAALSVTRLGVIESIPDLQETLALLSKIELAGEG